MSDSDNSRRGSKGYPRRGRGFRSGYVRWRTRAGRRKASVALWLAYHGLLRRCGENAFFEGFAQPMEWISGQPRVRGEQDEPGEPA